MTALRVEDLVVEIGQARLLDGINLTVPAGKIVAVVGANGAGKTTLLDTISGTLKRARGRVLVNESDLKVVSGRRPEGIGRVFQGSPLPATLTVAEVTALAAGSRKGAVKLMNRFGLTPFASRFTAELSTGMRRVLDLAVATVGNPSVLLLDEPSSGLAVSEVERLAEIIRRWRDATGAAVILVEHDALLVKKVADEVVMLDAGRVIAQGTPAEVFGGKVRTPPRVRDPGDPEFREALSRVTTNAVPATPPLRRSRSTWTILRLGLWQFASGLTSVLLLGVLNRVMKVELGISLALVAPVLASYNLAAPLALKIGHGSDTRPIAGRRRAPYIMAGALVCGTALALAPHLARFMASGINAFSVAVAVLLFASLGLGLYGGTTVFFALLADLTTKAERGYAASLVYLQLMAGILTGVALTVHILDDDAGGLGTLFAIAGVAVVALAGVAVWGQEKRAPAKPIDPDQAPEKFREAVRIAAAMPQVRLFFGFMVAVTVCLFLHQVIVEPFGGEVLGLTVRQTSAFNAMQTFGILIGMLVAGRSLADRYGHKPVAMVGTACASLAFAGLAAAAATQAAPPTWMALFLGGLAIGVANVGMLALMMSMIDPSRTALFIGGWTLAHALAVGIANASSGLLYEGLRIVVGSVHGGYAAVFAIQAIGLALCLPMLRRVDPDRFGTYLQPPSAQTDAAVKPRAPARGKTTAKPAPKAGRATRA